MTKTLITLAAAAFVMSAHAGGMGRTASHDATMSQYGTTELLSQSIVTRQVPQSHAASSTAHMGAAAPAMTSDTAAMGSSRATNASQSWGLGSTEALSQSSATTRR